MTGREALRFPNAKPREPSLKELASRVNSLASLDSRNVHMLVPHFRERMEERGITARLVLEVLRAGYGSGKPTLDPSGDWRITMRRKVAGRRVHVVVAVCDSHVDCITTW